MKTKEQFISEAEGAKPTGLISEREFVKLHSAFIACELYAEQMAIDFLQWSKSYSNLSFTDIELFEMYKSEKGL